MKNILITGAGSYVGNSVQSFLLQWPDEYTVDSVSTMNDDWKYLSYDKYDTVFHVAGIAHIRETKENKHLYYEINRDLAYDIAMKAKNSGVKQFIFMSSMSVYGMNTGVITRNTPTIPQSTYGDSKLQAENSIVKLEDESFNVCILRPPMIYGNGCKGNFQTVIRIVKKYRIFPKINNKRSLLHIDNLSSFIKKCIDYNLSGIFFPQNKEYMNTSQMALWISEKIGKKIILSRLLGFFVLIGTPFFNIIKKAFGNLVYEGVEEFNFDYCIKDLEKSVKDSIDV